MPRREPYPDGITCHFDRGIQHLGATGAEPNVGGLTLELAASIAKVKVDPECGSLVGMKERGAEAISTMVLHLSTTSVLPDSLTVT